MFVDSHCHLDRVDLTPYGGDFAAFMEAARREQVTSLLCVSIDLEAYPAMLELVEPYPDISVSVGVHPNERDTREPSQEELLDLAGHPKNIAIGETGLDYFRSDGDLGWQRERFALHIAAARAAAKPLIIHTRQARADTIAMLRSEGAADVGGVMHCFSEDWATAKAALDLGFYISFSGIVTFKNAVELRQVVEQVPLERLLIETDSPYLAPVPHRGKSNRPQWVRHVAEKIAEIRALPLAEVARLSSENFSTLFATSHSVN
jgi:TatD DNase family protein